MCLFKKIKNRLNKNEEQLKEVAQNVSDMKQTLDEVLKGALNKSKLYDETIGYLNDVIVMVDKVNITFNQETSTYGVKITYKVPQIELFFDKDKGFQENKRFKAMNMLDLISAEDMQKISNVIYQADEKNR